MKMFIYFTMMGPGNKAREDCVKEKEHQQPRLLRAV